MKSKDSFSRFIHIPVHESLTTLNGVDLPEHELFDQKSGASCGSGTKCLSVIDFNLKPASQWDTRKIRADNPDEKFDKVTVGGKTVDLDETLGACMMYRRMYKEGDMSSDISGMDSTIGHPSVTCQIHADPTGSRWSNLTSNDTRACGDEEGERWAYLEGPEVEMDPFESNKLSYQACVGQESGGSPHDCVWKGETYAEGTVKDISESTDIEMEKKGGLSSLPDREICLDIPGGQGGYTGEKGDLGLWKPIDNMDSPFRTENEGYVMDAGGEWYDLDNDTIRDYISYNGADTPTAPQSGNDITEGYVTYEDADEEWTDPPGVPWRKKLNENSSSKDLFLMEDDCYSYECDDSGRSKGWDTGLMFENMFHLSSESPSRFSKEPFNEGARLGEYDGYGYSGVHNRIQVWNDTHGGFVDEDEGAGTNQSNENPARDFGPWNNSEIDPVNDEWGVSPDLSYVITQGGMAFPPNNKCHGNRSSETLGMTVNKSYMWMANSAAGLENGKGVWYDPDVSSRFTDISCDLTRNDYGIGYDDRSSTFKVSGTSGGIGGPNRKEVKGPITWDIDDDPTVSTSNGYSQDVDDKQQFKSMCGDDRHEYLIRNKEGSDQKSPSKTNGAMYACADRPSDCVLDGQVYSEGALVDVSDTTAKDKEKGAESPDPMLRHR